MAYKVESVFSVYSLENCFVLIAKEIKCQVFTCFFENTY
jgi:hypothetical protein